MSGSLEFVSVDLALVAGFFRNGEPAVLQKLIDRSADLDGPCLTADISPIVWCEVARSLGGGKLGLYLASQPVFDTSSVQPELISRTRALLLVELIRQLGDSLGLVTHASGSSKHFLREPFDYLDQGGLLGPLKASNLADRPLFRQSHLELPVWGGLTRSELAALPLDLISRTDPSSGDTDVDSWLRGMLNCLEAAVDWNLDLVTIYE